MTVDVLSKALNLSESPLDTVREQESSYSGVQEDSRKRNSQRIGELQTCINDDITEEIQQAVKNRKLHIAAQQAKGRSVEPVNEALVENEVLKNRENRIMELCELLVVEGHAEEYRILFQQLHPLFSVFPKARMAKIARTLIDKAGNFESKAKSLQVELCLECIGWCEKEKRSFLLHRVQAKLAALYHQLKQYQKGLQVIANLLREVKQLDDKLLLVEVHLVETKLYFSVRHMPRAKAASTAARTNANAIHCPPILQAEIDVMAGALHAEEGDFRTAYSYFYEAFEAFAVQNSDQQAVDALKYMMLCRLMTGQSANIERIGKGAAGLKFSEHPEILCMREIGKAYEERSLEAFENVLEKYATGEASTNNHLQLALAEDEILSRHMGAARESLLEQNILKSIAPYSKIEVAQISKLTRLPLERIQLKLAEMILDKKLRGTLDQGSGCLIIFDEPPRTTLYANAISIFQSLTEVINSLGISS